MRCWPNHFDIATVANLDPGAKENARSIGIGVSPGNEYYAQPYAYVSPSPRFDVKLPEAPKPGRWHTEGFFGAVATGDALLGLPNRGQGFVNFIMEAVDIGRKRLGA